MKFRFFLLLFLASTVNFCFAQQFKLEVSTDSGYSEKKTHIYQFGKMLFDKKGIPKAIKQNILDMYDWQELLEANYTTLKVDKIKYTVIYAYGEGYEGAITAPAQYFVYKGNELVQIANTSKQITDAALANKLQQFLSSKDVSYNGATFFSYIIQNSKIYYYADVRGITEGADDFYKRYFFDEAGNFKGMLRINSTNDTTPYEQLSPFILYIPN